MVSPKEDYAAALSPTRYIDSDDPAVIAFAEANAGEGSDRERAVRLYYAVRDGFRYDPYSIDLEPDSYRASACLARGHGYCITKSVLLAAAARAQGIPARLGFADVRNHLATPRLLETLGTDIFHYHGYTSLWLDGRWVKATPAFNIELCERFGVKPLEFDGREDSVFHPFDMSGRQHMEYILDRGEHDDLPFEALRDCMLSVYPRLFAGEGGMAGDFHAEASAARG